MCPGTGGPARGYLAIHEIPGARGMVVLHGGGPAGRYWAENGEAWAALETLHANGLATVQVRWAAGWTDPDGEAAGPRALACRPATVVQWVHDNLYNNLDTRVAPDDSAGVCGFCYTGNSAGAGAIAYALSYYGLDQILDAAVLTSGPPFSDLDAACLPQPSRRSLALDQTSSARIDEQYGRAYPGPCARSDPAWAARWQADSLDGAGGDWSHPTRIHVILGDRDVTGALPHARHYVRLLEEHGTPARVDMVVGMGHTVQESPHAMALMVASLSAGASTHERQGS